MKKLIDKVQDLGWFEGEFKLNIEIASSFEGYSGRATETWELQYRVKTDGMVTDGGQGVFPPLDMKSRPYEPFNDFIKRVEEKL